MPKIGFALTSSFCTLDEVLIQMQALVDNEYDIVPIVSPAVIDIDTRFGKGKDFKQKIETICDKEVVSSIVEAEKFGSIYPLDSVVVAPATGNFIGKLANGITDSPVNMAVKATLRNHKPIIIGISTNDGLGINGENIMKLMNTKDIFFIPFGQDNCNQKPNSLKAHYQLLKETLEAALNNKQYQPVLKEHVKTLK